MEKTNTYTAFDDGRIVAKGPLSEVVLWVKRRMGKANHSPILIFSDDTGNPMDFNFQGDQSDVRRRLEIFGGSRGQGSEQSPAGNPGPGRPRLGVVSREVSLLPRQWEWLASQSGGASAVLRRLVDEGRKRTLDGTTIKQTQERTYKFLSVIAGDFPGYEEAIRALYKKDRQNFLARIGDWPADVRAHALEMAGPVFEKGERTK